MNIEDLPSSLQIRQVNFHNPIKSTRANKGSIEQILPVSGCHDDYMTISIKSIHLNKDLIERIISLIVRAMTSTPLTTDSIDLIDEDDGWGFLSCCCKQLANP